MNRQQVYECFKEVMAKYGGSVPPEAEKYIFGDDNMYEQIKKGSLRGVSYPNSIVEELDGPAGEMAKRCLRAIVAMRVSGMAGSSFNNELKYAHKLGFSLKDVLDSDMSSFCEYGFAGTSFTDTATSLEKMYSHEIENTVTSDYLKERLKERNGNSTSMNVAFVIAARLYMKNHSPSLKKQLMSFIRSCSERSVLLLLSQLYKDKEFGGILREKLTGIDKVYSLYLLTGRDSDEMYNILKKIDMDEYFTIYAALGVFGDKAHKAALSVVDSDPDRYLPELIKNAHTREFTPIACEVVMRYKESPLFPGAVSELETIYTEMLSCIEGSFYVGDESGKRVSETAMAVRHVIHNNKEKAVQLIKFGSASLYAGKTDSILKAFMSLRDYSPPAKDITDVLMLSCKNHFNELHLKRFSELLDVFLRAQSDAGIPLKNSLDELISLGITHKMIFYAPVARLDSYFDKLGENVIPAAVMLAEKYPEEAADFFNWIKDDVKSAAYWAELLYKKADFRNTDVAIKLLGMNTKNAVKTAGAIISEDEELFRADLEKALPSLKGDGAKKAAEIIRSWDNERKYGGDFKFTSDSQAEEFVSENIDRAKDKSVSFIPAAYYENIRYADHSGNASVDMIKYIIGEYMSLSEPARLNDCGKLAEMLDAADFDRFLEKIYTLWLENGADIKKKMILLPYCIFGTDTRIISMKKQLLEWADTARGALAAFAVNAAALNGGSAALLLISDISEKFPNSMVKKAAKSAFTLAADALGVPEDALADRIVPSLGFDKNGEMLLDYGGRTFTAALNRDFTLTVTDNAKNKIIKTLPKPAASDDENKAAEAKKTLSDIKKHLKTVTASQKARLEKVFMNGRKWTAAAWKELFSDNPIMRVFAMGLVWGIYENGKLTDSFGYGEDGTLYDKDGNMFSLPENAEISILHPVETDNSVICAWKDRLSERGAEQPFPQLDAKVITLSENDIDGDGELIKYNARKATAGALTGAFKKYGLIRSSVEDGGVFAGYHLRDGITGLGFAMNFDTLYVGQDSKENVNVERIYFYRASESGDKPMSYADYTTVSPYDIPSRFLSCCLDITEKTLK